MKLWKSDQKFNMFYVSIKTMTNSSLRDRFKSVENNYFTAYTTEADLIKDYDPDPDPDNSVKD
ncbi:hypothetical protein [Clostridium saccharobutylicum]|uniref:Uncharacterized protein n=1 Tax=Clostridium saccharobutylicum DSM 13864 TaxID=1345695 RepID=U5MLL7_CLOSA|nr:hypothetical protein [Clostridium saccharobutylicum]AGX41480.1 hypothetical protein CLSA_c04490 [Clostridium saccharobutylicum DSM 13864]AQR88760.1 hypothetical protein CLOSC_04370 [Clostridium saccharobutylicum]AQR98658.1 hypothetical protein CSACC_04430 [Clostridium saccharobutylicum]AQS12648.1 hypothetical protein CLOSACC_04430 [Clostridium saccharobutylicum]MBA2905668.1 hypothetical protein [Clostridium saccharobutylicum]